MNTLKCGHKFHTGCINKWKDEGKNTCPFCRKKFREPKYSALVMLYPSVGHGRVTTLPLPQQYIECFLRAVNIETTELTQEGESINLHFETNDDLIDFFSELGVPIDDALSEVTEGADE